jgi:hypothetical protein
MSAVLLTDAKTFLNVTVATHDAELQSMLDRAEAILARRVGPLSLTTVTDEVHTGPGPLLLKRYPVVSVTSATSDGVAVSDLDLDVDTGLLYGAFTSGFRKVRVTYTAGRAVPPADLEAAVLELVKHLWESQRPAGAQAPPGSLAGDDIQPGGSYLLPYRVQSLIEPHLLTTVA